jgi:hypothetical protein
MKLIMKDFEKQLLAHHSGHVHLEAGTTTSSGSSRRRLQSACRHFSFRQPCLNPPHPLHWLFEAGRPQAAYRCLCDKPRPVSARSVGCFGLGDALWVWMSRPATSGGLRWLKTGSILVCGVIELGGGVDFKMNLFMEDLEQYLAPHLDEYVQPELGSAVRSGSSSRLCVSASRHFPRSQPPPPTCDCCAAPGVTELQFSSTHWLMEASGTFFWPPGAGHRLTRRESGLIGACAGCWWVMKTRIGCSCRHPADGRQELREAQEREHGGREGDAGATSQANTSSCMPSY